MPLSERSLTVLDFESRWGAHTPEKEEAIRREMQITPARYYQLLERALAEPDAAAHDALLVHRLRRLSAAREREDASRARVPTGTGR